jgi:hypothetical protein
MAARSDRIFKMSTVHQMLLLDLPVRR